MTFEWKDYVKYDPTSKSFLRKIKGRSVGSEVGAINGSKKRGYYYRCKILDHASFVHRVILNLFGIEVPEGKVVDHIDGNSLNNSIDNLRVIDRPANNMNFKMYSTNSTMVTGVKLNNAGSGNYYFSAFWNDLDKRHRIKHFSIGTLGVMVAFRDAVIYRQNMIATLNEQGAGYTERHGK